MTTTLSQDRRGTIAIMVGAMIVPLMILAALIVDSSVWITASTRLQLAADAAAQSTAQMLSTSTFKSQSAAAQQTSLQTVALYEAQQAATKLVGSSMAATVTYDGSTYKWVAVKLTSQAPTYFGGVNGAVAPILSASSTATLSGTAAATPPACVVALGTSGSTTIPDNSGVTTADAINGGTGILVDNGAKLQAPNCPVFSNVNYNSPTQYSIYASGTGTISGLSVGAAGNIQTISSATITSTNPSTPTPNTTPIVDPYAGTTVTAPTACTVGTDATAAGTISATTTYNAGTVFCGPVTFDNAGFTGRTMTFNSGIYYVQGGGITFNKMGTYTFAAAGVTFVMLPNTRNSKAAGNFLWALAAPSAALTGMTTGATAGFAIMQPCGSGTLGNGQISLFGTGLTISGAIWAPCSEFQANSNATIAPPLNGTLSVVARVVHLQQSSTLNAVAASTGGGTGSGPPNLTQ